MFGKKIFISVALVATLFLDSACAKRSHSKRHHKSINIRNVNDTQVTREVTSDGIEVVNVDLLSLAYSEEELKLFDYGFLKRSSQLATTSATVPNNIQNQNSGIGSWFRTDSSQDSTNSRSWCGFPYSDSDPGFAISLDLMGGSQALFGKDTKLWDSATDKFCGLEAQVSYNGKSMLMYVIDAFDPQWVRTPFSIDIIQPAFEQLWGSQTNNKNDVMKSVSWKLTGRRAAQYTAHN